MTDDAPTVLLTGDNEEERATVAERTADDFLKDEVLAPAEVRRTVPDIPDDRRTLVDTTPITSDLVFADLRLVPEVA